MAPLPVRQEPVLNAEPPPEGPHAALKDGTFLQGSLEEPAKLRIRIAAGTIEIPADSVRSIRLAPFREEELRGLAGRIEGLVRQLGHSDYEKREAAQRELLRIGSAAAERLKASAEDPDFEIRTRIQEILGKIESGEAGRAPDRDEISGRGFYARGWLETKEIAIRTEQGIRRLPIAGISSVSLDAPAGGAPLPEGGLCLALRDGTRLPGRWTDGKLELETPAGRKALETARILEIRPWGSDVKIRTSEGFSQGRLLSLQGTFETPYGRLSPAAEAIEGLTIEAPVAIRAGETLEGGIRVAAVSRDAGGPVYAVLLDPKGMDRAAAEAIARKVGGRLATIASAEENRTIEEMLAPAEGQDVIACHIGLSDPGMRGQWRWSDGKPLGFANWAPGEPNRLGGEEVVEIYFTRDDQNGRWNDIHPAVSRHGCVVRFD